ncbi:MAG: tetratricopeptide repeat protein [Planctomycetota bacterium]|jgi:predicted regulator of Ras-like GTPase activity (Roadblock/LC7/MglB family)
MGLFDNMRKRKEIARLEKAAEDRPAPETISALATKLHEQGEIDRALEVAEKGLELFPLSDRVQSVFKFIRKQQLLQKIRDIKEKIRTNPSAAVYGQLATIYKDMGETHTAVDICKELEEKFPLSENSYMIIGEIREQRFREDRLANDGLKAMENLENALEINGHNYKALLMLAEIYIRIGAFNLAIERLDAIGSFAPTDDRVRKLLEEARELVNPEADEDEEELEFLFMDVENRKAFLYDVREVEEGLGKLIERAAVEVGERAPSTEMLKRRLERLDKLPGFMGALALDRDGREICGKVPFHVNKETFDRVVQQILGAARNASLRMDVGDFMQGDVEGPFGKLVLQYGDGIVLGVMAEPKTRTELIHQQVKSILSGVAAAG